MSHSERKASVSPDELEEMTIAVTPPEGFSWPWSAKNYPVWIPVTGSPVEGVEVSNDGTVRIRPDAPSRSTYEWLNKLDVNTGNYASYLTVGNHRYERWQLVWSAITGTPVDLLRDSGLTVIRADRNRHDFWSNLLGLTTPKDELVELTQEDLDRAEITHCENHFHAPSVRGSWDGAKIRTGTDCVLPDGEKRKTKNKGTKNVTYRPATGETTQHYF